MKKTIHLARRRDADAPLRSRLRAVHLFEENGALFSTWWMHLLTGEFMASNRRLRAVRILKMASRQHAGLMVTFPCAK